MRRRKRSHIDHETQSEPSAKRSVTFDGLAELANYAKNAPVVTNGSHGTDAHYSNHGWTHGVSFEQAIEMAETGWPEGAAKARKLLDSIPDLAPTESVASATYHDVSGSYVDVGEYVQGVPECMVDFREDKRTARFARIIVGGFYSAGISANTIMQRGVGIAAIVDALESRGVRCDIEHVTAMGDWESRVTLKRATDPLNLDVLAFAIAHPAMFRRLNFAVQEMEPEDIRIKYHIANFGSYGYKADITENPGELVFQSMASNEDWSVANSQKRVIDALKRFALED